VALNARRAAIPRRKKASLAVLIFFIVITLPANDRLDRGSKARDEASGPAREGAHPRRPELSSLTHFPQAGALNGYSSRGGR
jgi:hypothetical protein